MNGINLMVFEILFFWILFFSNKNFLLIFKELLSREKNEEEISKESNKKETMIN